jgi:hypothetical protein
MMCMISPSMDAFQVRRFGFAARRMLCQRCSLGDCISSSADPSCLSRVLVCWHWCWCIGSCRGPALPPQESLSTLKFANRAKNIKNQAVVNEDLDQRKLLFKYEHELKKLRSELTRRNGRVASAGPASDWARMRLRQLRCGHQAQRGSPLPPAPWTAGSWWTSARCWRLRSRSGAPRRTS